jgi:MGT family glycosyltransferase
MKVLCIPYTHTLSHVSRPLAVAEELRRRGHEVVFAGEGSKIAFIVKKGFPVFPLYEPDPRELYGNIRQGRLRFVSDADIFKMLQADAELYAEVRPDLVLSDGRFTAPISCHIASLKHAALVNVSSTEYRALPYVPLFDWFPEALAPRNSPLRGLLDRLNLFLEMRVFDQAMKTFAMLSKRHKLRKIITATNCLVGKDLTLVPDIPEYFPTRNLPDNYHYIGPLTLRHSCAMPGWWQAALAKNKPIVYITMGTTGLEEFFTKAVDYFRDLDAIAVITTGGQASPPGALPDNIFVEEYLNGDEVMAAASLVVCHGGNGTIYQALLQGKPIIGIPTIPDQQFNMRQVQRLGVGVSVEWQSFSKDAQTLLDAITRVLGDPGFLVNARRLQGLLQSYNAPVLAADLLEKLMLEKESNHGRK